MQFTYKVINTIPVINFLREDGSFLETDFIDFGEEILGIIDEGVYKVVLDLRKHHYLNSFGLGELIHIRNYFLEKGITCVLILNSKKIIKLFDMVGIGELFETIASEKEI